MVIGTCADSYYKVHTSYAMLSSGMLWNMPRKHLYFLYTHEPLGESVYEKNTSDKWHIPQYPMRKHCITTLSHA